MEIYKYKYFIFVEDGSENTKEIINILHLILKKTLSLINFYIKIGKSNYFINKDLGSYKPELYRIQIFNLYNIQQIKFKLNSLEYLLNCDQYNIIKNNTNNYYIKKIKFIRYG